MIADNVGDPDTVLLVDRDSERGDQLAGILQGITALVLTQKLALRWITLGEMHYLTFHRVERPDIAVRRDDDALHLSELAVEVPALGRRQRFARIVELRNRLRLEVAHPHVIAGIEREPEAWAADAAARESGQRRRQRLAVRRYL